MGEEKEFVIKGSLGMRAGNALEEALKQAGIIKEPSFRDKRGAERYGKYVAAVRTNMDDVILGKAGFFFVSAKPSDLEKFVENFKARLKDSDSLKEFGEKVRIELAGNKVYFRSKDVEQKEAQAKKESEESAKKVVPTKFSAEGLGPEAKKLAATLSKAATGVPLHPQTIRAVNTFLEAYDKYQEAKEHGIAGRQNVRLPFTSNDVATKFFDATVAELSSAGIKDVIVSKPAKIKGAYVVELVLPGLQRATAYEEEVVEGKRKKK